MIPVGTEKVKFSGDFQEFERMPAGAYVCKVVDVAPNPQKEYLLLTLDVVEGEFANFGKKVSDRTGKDFGYIKIYKSWKDNKNPENNRNPIWWFKQMLARFEKENPGKYQQTDNNEEHLIGLLIGVVVREEEYLNKDNEVKTSVKFYNFAEISRIRDGKLKTPDPKLLPEEQKNPPLVSDATKAVADKDDCPF